ncbi:MAG: YkgJ family cysteine cluster protein [Bacteroidota bacterium]
MPLLNIKTFQRRASRKKKELTAFMRKVGKSKTKGILKVAAETDKEVWKEMACLDCANCCTKMTPTYTRKDVNRIAKHFKMTYKQFFDKWLTVDDNKDIINQSLPCQFLGKDKKCTIYAIRPDDCAGFPHFTRKDFRWQTQEKTFTGNLSLCPATLVFVEKLKEKVEAGQYKL